MQGFESSSAAGRVAGEGATGHALASVGSAQRLRRQLSGLDLMAYGLTYIALVSPLSTMGFVWVASGGQIALAYLIGLVCISFTAMSYASMARRVPEAGSAYAFTRHALGPRAGFLAGWLLLLDYLLIPALVFVMMSIGMDTVAPGLGRMFWLVALVVVTLGINWLGIKITTRASLFSVLIQGAVLVGVSGVVRSGFGRGCRQRGRDAEAAVRRGSARLGKGTGRRGNLHVVVPGLRCHFHLDRRGAGGDAAASGRQDCPRHGVGCWA